MKINSYKINISMDAKAFIIPNPPIIPAKDPYYCRRKATTRPIQSERINALKKMAELNGREFDPNDMLVQMWYHTDDCQNLTNHHPHISIGDVEYELVLSTDDYIPMSYLDGHNDGDVIELKIPVELINCDRDTWVSGVWEATITLDQKNSRYCRQTFAETLDRMKVESYKLYGV